MLSAGENAASSHLQDDERYDTTECAIIAVDTYIGHDTLGHVAQGKLVIVAIHSVMCIRVCDSMG